MTNSDISIFSPSMIIPVILCGGSGSRLWPLSQDDKPKQLLPVINQKILLHDTLERIEKCFENDFNQTIIITTKKLEKETRTQARAYNPDCTNHILCEPCSRNTAAAVAYAALYAKEKFGPNAILWIIPADHYIHDLDKLNQTIQSIRKNPPNNKIITLGIKPTYPSTEYGYIQYNSKENSYSDVIKFVEKPDIETAQKYYKDDHYLWNSGMFIASFETILDEYKKHESIILNNISSGLKNNKLQEAYEEIKAISFDYAIMEKTQNACVIKIDIGWSDVGSWEHVWQLKDKNSDGNALEGNIVTQNSQNCLIKSNNLMVAACGLKDMVIIEEEHSILIANKHDNYNISKLKSALDKYKTSQENHNTEKLVSKNTDYLVKEITLQQNEIIPLHYHSKRSEQLIVLSGTAHININGEELDYEIGASVSIPLTVEHSIRNLSQSPLKLLEIQYGGQTSPFDITYIEEAQYQDQMRTI